MGGSSCAVLALPEPTGEICEVSREFVVVIGIRVPAVSGVAVHLQNAILQD